MMQELTSVYAQKRVKRNYTYGSVEGYLNLAMMMFIAFSF